MAKSTSIIEILRRQKRMGRNALSISVVLLGIAAYLFTQSRQFYTSAVRVGGSVVALETNRSKDNITIYPVFSFVDTTGGEHIVQSSRSRVFSDFWHSYSVGDAVEVLYSPNEPETARINYFAAIWGWPTFIGAAGLLFGIVGIGLWYFAVTARVDKLEADVKRGGKKINSDF